MLSQLFDGAEIHGLHRLSGGASRETWRFEADGRPLILQRQRAVGDEREHADRSRRGPGGRSVAALPFRNSFEA